jgi:SET domain-containing protein
MKKMKNILFQNKLIVKKSKLHGYGVFAGKTIKKGEKIEECYMLVTKRDDIALENFYFDARGRNALLLGFGCIYNHSNDPNADYVLKIKQRVAIIKATKLIPKGNEIFIDYGEEWFSSRGKKSKM